MGLYGYIKPYMISLTRGVFPNVVSIWNLFGFDKYTLDKKLFLMRIVLLHIFGNDLDNNAIEVAKLNLLIEIIGCNIA